jgi:lysophospholipase L1-like esterase
MVKKIGQWLLAIAISLVCVELLLQGVVRLGFVDIDLPSYSMTQARPFWQELNADFGVWHPANAHYRHRRSCFDLIYTSNAYGMRDRDVAMASPSRRVVVLGDSFVEGWGVDGGHRFTDQLAALTGIQHLNFGVAGDFGPTQESVLYKTLAAKFDHRAVILTILPENDFLDDMPFPQRLVKGARHRPFLIGHYPDYRLQYPAGDWAPDQHPRWFAKNVLREFWLTFRVGDHAVQLAQQLVAYWRHKGDFNPLHSFYFDYRPEDFDRLRYAIEQIKATAGDRPLLIVTIPVAMDYWRAASTDTTPPLTRELTDLSAKLGITYIDLLQRMNGAERDRYFLACDPHWSDLGHRRAAEVIATWDFYGK